jgi:hypothetical protein
VDVERLMIDTSALLRHVQQSEAEAESWEIPRIYLNG